MSHPVGFTEYLNDTQDCTHRFDLYWGVKVRKTMTEAHKIETLLKLTREHLDIMFKAKAEGKAVDKEITRDCLEIEKYEALLSEAK